MPLVHLGLGSNLGDRAATIAAALKAMPIYGLHVLARSGLYETEPWGVTDQPRFLNGACIARTSLPPMQVLIAIKAIERALGRTATIRWGPRTIDIDLLLWEGVVMATPELTLPHPGMTERASVLIPLAELAPELVHPVSGRSVREHLLALGTVDGVAPYPPGLAPSEDSSRSP